MSIRRAVLFLEDGRGSPILAGQWTSKGAARPLPRVALVQRGRATHDFETAWNYAFPTREPLPAEIANRDGTGTDQFWRVFS